MITDPLFYALAVPAILIVGIAKGGLGGGAGIVGVPLMALAIGPAQAAAILLPILVVLDVLALRTWWGRWDLVNLKIIIPGALGGVLLGWATFHQLSADGLRILVGCVAIGFAVLHYARPMGRAATGPHRGWGTFLGGAAGFTSFGIHAGGPPLNLYLLPQNLDKSVFQGTVVGAFTFVNLIKLPPYWFLGQFDWGNLTTSLMLAPLAPIGILAGAWLHHRIDQQTFFHVVHASLLLIGAKLLYDGLTNVLTIGS